MAGIYIHIPFCKQACHYCDFHFSTNIAIKFELLQCMQREITLQKDYLTDFRIHTIYFGGGTPSLLSAQELETLLQPIQALFSVNADVEVTLEANPDDLTLKKLTEFKSAGINRLSIGIQSFNDHALKFLNRSHDAASAFDAVKNARRAGFDNISIDLIYAIPGDTWHENIRHALNLEPEHLSAYALTIEEKTVFGHWASRGKISTITDDQAATYLEMLVDQAEKAGYEQYEVSNFSKSGFESKHNSSYWRQQQYLGIGPGAHSYNLTSRQHNIRNNHIYVRALKTGVIPFEKEILSKDDHINEYLLTTLRTKWGSDLNKLKHDFGYDLMHVHQQFIAGLMKKNLMVLDGHCLKLSKAGLLLADKITTDLFL